MQPRPGGDAIPLRESRADPCWGTRKIRFSLLKRHRLAYLFIFLCKI